MQKGFHAASVREIGDSLGISQSSLYYHAKSKPQILVDLNERFMRRLLASMEEIAVQPLPPSAKLRAVIRQLVSVTSQYQAEVTVVLQERSSLPARHLKPIQKQRDRIDEILDQILQVGMDTGEFRRLDVPLTRLALTGMCNWAYAWYHADGRLQPEQIATYFGTVFLDGISRPARR
jgi:TetR/AcrR family transcriptional regulator, cholesterol catabolism regulator